MRRRPHGHALPSAVICMLLLVALAADAAAQSKSADPDSALPRPELALQISQLLAAPEVAHAHWGIAVSGLDGSVVLSVDGGKLFHPASNAKLFTTAAAMALLGPDATVTTRIEARGQIAEGALTGDLALVGAGDADFATEDTPYQPPAPLASHAGPVQSSANSTGLPSIQPAPLHALEAMADRVVASGLRSITGDIVGDDTAFSWEPYPEDWAADDLLWGYGAPVSALSLHDNQLALHVVPGIAPGAAVQVMREPGMPPWFTLDVSALTTAAPNSGDHVEVGPVPGQPRTFRLWGTIAAGAPEEIEEIALPDPALFAAESLRAMLLARGVSVGGIARAQHRLPMATASFRAQATEPLTQLLCAGDDCTSSALQPLNASTLAEAVSPALLADETVTNKLSLNLHAELLLERLGQRFGVQGPPTTAADPASRAQGVRATRSILPLAGIAPDDVVLVDGSGLSTHDLVTPRALVQLLTWSASQPWFSGWRSTLPIGGVDGTLAGRFRKAPLAGRVVAKTGTLGESRALSGYLTCASGRVVAFAILADNHDPGSSADRDTADRIVAALYAAL